MSNVLEHIDQRVEFLKKIRLLANKFLFRVPMIDREWVTLYTKGTWPGLQIRYNTFYRVYMATIQK
jgi:hypothetical protein